MPWNRFFFNQLQETAFFFWAGMSGGLQRVHASVFLPHIHGVTSLWRSASSSKRKCWTLIWRKWKDCCEPPWIESEAFFLSGLLQDRLSSAGVNKKETNVQNLGVSSEVTAKMYCRPCLQAQQGSVSPGYLIIASGVIQACTWTA